MEPDPLYLSDGDRYPSLPHPNTMKEVKQLMVRDEAWALELNELEYIQGLIYSQQLLADLQNSHHIAQDWRSRCLGRP